MAPQIAATPITINFHAANKNLPINASTPVLASMPPATSAPMPYSATLSVFELKSLYLLP